VQKKVSLRVLYLDFGNMNNAKNILCTDPSAKNILCSDPSLSVQEKEYLPVRALYFGDTGTPLDRKEARFNLGPLECHGDTLFTHSVTFRRQVCGVFFLDRGPELDCKDVSGW
jgi:hypothetical protein